MASTPQEVGRILKIVRESGIPFCVGHNRRSAPAVMDAVDLLDRHRADPKIGRPGGSTATRTCARPSRKRGKPWCCCASTTTCCSWKPWAFEEGADAGGDDPFHRPGEPVHRRASRAGSSPWAPRARTLPSSSNTMMARSPPSPVPRSGTLDYPKELIEITHQRGDDRHRSPDGDSRDGHRRGAVPPQLSRPSIRTRNPSSQGIEAFYDYAQQTIEHAAATGNRDIFIGFPNKGHYDHLDRFAHCVRGEAPSPCDALEGAKATMMTLKAIESCRLGLPLRFGTEEYQIIAL